MSCLVLWLPRVMLHVAEPRHLSGRLATSRRLVAHRSVAGSMWRLESRDGPATHTRAPVLATVTTGKLVPSREVTTSTDGWLGPRPSMEATALDEASTPAVVHLALMQHLLKRPSFL